MKGTKRDNDSNDEEYKQKRAKNNLAVKQSREKKKEIEKAIAKEHKRLAEEIKKLEGKIEEQNQNKEMFLGLYLEKIKNRKICLNPQEIQNINEIVNDIEADKIKSEEGGEKLLSEPEPKTKRSKK